MKDVNFDKYIAEYRHEVNKMMRKRCKAIRKNVDNLELRTILLNLCKLAIVK